MIHVTFGPDGRTGKMLFGKVEIDDLDISRKVCALSFVRKQDGTTLLTLDLAISGEDALRLAIPEEDVVVTGRVFRDGEVIEVAAAGDAAKKYLRAGA